MTGREGRRTGPRPGRTAPRLVLAVPRLVLAVPRLGLGDGSRAPRREDGAQGETRAPLGRGGRRRCDRGGRRCGRVASRSQPGTVPVGPRSRHRPPPPGPRRPGPRLPAARRPGTGTQPGSRTPRHPLRSPTPPRQRQHPRDRGVPRRSRTCTAERRRARPAEGLDRAGWFRRRHRARTGRPSRHRGARRQPHRRSRVLPARRARPRRRDPRHHVRPHHPHLHGDRSERPRKSAFPTSDVYGTAPTSQLR